jgi:hypothetical protein
LPGTPTPGSALHMPRELRGLHRQPGQMDHEANTEGALWDDFFPCREDVGVMASRSGVHGTAMPREMVSDVQDILL